MSKSKKFIDGPILQLRYKLMLSLEEQKFARQNLSALLKILDSQGRGGQDMENGSG
jgi:hypothetical protein